MTGGGLSEAERAEVSARALADDLCAGSTHPRDEEAGDFHCQECYDIANTVHDSPWLRRVLAARADATQQPLTRDERRSLAAVYGYKVGYADGQAAATQQAGEAWAHVVRDHDMPPNKDRRGYDYRMGWWDAIAYAHRILTRGLRACEECPGKRPAAPAREADPQPEPCWACARGIPRTDGDPQPDAGVREREVDLWSAARDLLALKDGPRDSLYYERKADYWNRLRAAVESAATHPTTPHGSDQGERGRA